jgi:hypothetical protein
MIENTYRVSLKIAKLLKEAGFPQDGCDAYWCCGYDIKRWMLLSINELDRRVDTLSGQQRIRYISAPCVGRLGDELKKFPLPIFYNGEDKWHCADETIEVSKFDKEVDARALLYIKLKQLELL